MSAALFIARSVWPRTLSGTMPPPALDRSCLRRERPPDTPSPALAAILGFIPGVGAMYNGEFAKGFIHVLIFATLIWMTDHVNGLFGICASRPSSIYMPIEAYKTARAREHGIARARSAWPEQSLPARSAAGVPAAGYSLPPVRLRRRLRRCAVDAIGEVPQPNRRTMKPHSRLPVGAFILIGLGVLFLLDELGALHFDWIWRFWPLILIAIGVRILMQRQRRGW